MWTVLAIQRVVQVAPHPLSGCNLRGGHQIIQMLRNSVLFMEVKKVLFKSVCLAISAVTFVVKSAQHLASRCTNTMQKGQFGSMENTITIHQLESGDNLEL